MSLRFGRKPSPRFLAGRQASGADYLGTKMSKHYVKSQLKLFKDNPIPWAALKMRENDSRNQKLVLATCQQKTGSRDRFFNQNLDR